MSAIDLQSLRLRRDEIADCAAAHGAHNVQVFGSVARREAASTSDVDFLVEMEPGRSLLDLVALWQALGDMLGGEVDVLSEDGLNPHLRDRILSEAVPLQPC